MRTPDAEPDAAPFRFAVVIAEFNDHITNRLLDGARDCLQKFGASSVTEHWVPGAFELPLAAQLLAETGRYDAVICLGAVIRGETPHFEYVSAETARGIQQAMLASGVPIAFGVLTTDDEEQAEARAGGGLGNKGWDAALTAIQMAVFAAQVDASTTSETHE
jgi:6,7-dimethyl-8-ribityllumazine synthase